MFIATNVKKIDANRKGSWTISDSLMNYEAKSWRHNCSGLWVTTNHGSPLFWVWSCDIRKLSRDAWHNTKQSQVTGAIRDHEGKEITVVSTQLSTDLHQDKTFLIVTVVTCLHKWKNPEKQATCSQPDPTKKMCKLVCMKKKKKKKSADIYIYADM